MTKNIGDIDLLLTLDRFAATLLSFATLCLHPNAYILIFLRLILTK
jgi:hypothetical protein